MKVEHLLLLTLQEKNKEGHFQAFKILIYASSVSSIYVCCWCNAGEPNSVSVDSETLRLALSPVSPGSTYEVRVMSVLGRGESDSIQDTVTTCKLPIVSRESDIRSWGLIYKALIVEHAYA